MNAKALKLENIFKSFGDVKVLKDIKQITVYGQIISKTLSTAMTQVNPLSKRSLIIQIIKNMM